MSTSRRKCGGRSGQLALGEMRKIMTRAGRHKLYKLTLALPQSPLVVHYITSSKVPGCESS